MTEKAVLCDLTEFIANPVRTGIQRVTYEILSRWPGPRPLVPARVTADGKMVLVAAKIFEEMAAYFGGRDGDEKAKQRILAYAGRNGTALSRRDLGHYHAVLNTELFFAEPRVDFYRKLLADFGERTFVIFYDWLPWLHPECFPHDAPLGTMPYLTFAREVRNAGFISEQTKRDYLTRILRAERRVGPVLPLGSDALGKARPEFSPAKRRFVCLGTIEPRKNHRVILDAFADIWRQGVDARLTFVGRMGWADEDLRRRVEVLPKEEPRFEWQADLADDRVREEIRGSRATIYLSEREGYGLPPVESLALGVPAIVCESIPSIEMIEPLGQLRLKTADRESLREAVLDLLDDDFAQKKHDEIERLDLPTWDDLSREVALWIERSR